MAGIECVRQKITGGEVGDRQVTDPVGFVDQSQVSGFGSEFVESHWRN